MTGEAVAAAPYRHRLSRPLCQRDRRGHVRRALVGTIVERAVARGQLPPGTNATELMRYVAAPLFHRLLVMAEPLTTAHADQAAAAAVAAARAGVLISGPT